MGLLLTDSGADAFSVDREGLTPLMAAAANGCGATALKLLVAAGASVNTAVAGGQRAGWTAVMYAAAAGDAVAAAELCKLGADVKVACARRRTAVGIAYLFCTPGLVSLCEFFPVAIDYQSG
jgi:ankyrin repeat protein